MSRRIVYIQVPVIINYNGVQLKEHVNRLFKRDVFVGEEYKECKRKHSLVLLEQFQTLEKIKELNETTM